MNTAAICAVRDVMVKDKMLYSYMTESTRILVSTMETRIRDFINNNRDEFPLQATGTILQSFVIAGDDLNKLAYIMLNHYRKEFSNKMSQGLLTGLSKRFPSFEGEPIGVANLATELGSAYQHFNPITGDYTCDEPTKETYEEYEMHKILPVVTVKNLINGNDSATMSFDEHVSALQLLESKIDTLTSIKAKSKAVDKQVKQYKKDIKAVIKLMDGE